MLNLSVKFDLISFIVFSIMADKRFVSDKPMTFNCDLDLGSRNLNFVCNIPSYFAKPFYEAWLNSLHWFLSYD